MFRFDVSGQIGTASISAAGEVNQGECLLVTGPSGAGKTTLLRMLAGLHPLTSGDVSLDDETWNGPAHVTPTEARDIGFVFQDSALFPRMSVAENVAFGLAHGSSRGAVVDLISKLGLKDHASAKACTLSGGEQQRVAVARAIAKKPKLLLLDEPLTALDGDSADQTATVIASAIAELSIPAVIVAHAPTPVVPIAPVALRLDQGLQGRAIPSAEAFV